MTLHLHFDDNTMIKEGGRIWPISHGHVERRVKKRRKRERERRGRKRQLLALALHNSDGCEIVKEKFRHYKHEM